MRSQILLDSFGMRWPVNSGERNDESVVEFPELRTLFLDNVVYLASVLAWEDHSDIPCVAEPCNTFEEFSFRKGLGEGEESCSNGRSEVDLLG